MLGGVWGVAGVKFRITKESCAERLHQLNTWNAIDRRITQDDCLFVHGYKEEPWGISVIKQLEGSRIGFNV